MKAKCRPATRRRTRLAREEDTHGTRPAIRTVSEIRAAGVRRRRAAPACAAGCRCWRCSPPPARRSTRSSAAPRSIRNPSPPPRRSPPSPCRRPCWPACRHQRRPRWPPSRPRAGHEPQAVVGAGRVGAPGQVRPAGHVPGILAAALPAVVAAGRRAPPTCSASSAATRRLPGRPPARRLAAGRRPQRRFRHRAQAGAGEEQQRADRMRDPRRQAHERSARHRRPGHGRVPARHRLLGPV